LALRRGSTGYALDTGESSQVRFKPFGAEVIEQYLRLVHTLDKAGAYSIQDHTDLIVAGYQGSFSNIMGLPMELTKQILTPGVLPG
jgi:septum formation protein